MKYGEEYESKWGFGDGDSMPPDAHQVRTVQIYAVNRLCEALDSKFRLVPLFRNGMHNCWLWTTRPATEVAGLIEQQGAWNFAEGNVDIPVQCWDGSISPPDEEPWWDVLDMCREVGYEFVNSRNQIRKTALDKWIRYTIDEQNHPKI